MKKRKFPTSEHLSFYLASNYHIKFRWNKKKLHLHLTSTYFKFEEKKGKIPTNIRQKKQVIYELHPFYNIKCYETIFRFWGKNMTRILYSLNLFFTIMASKRNSQKFNIVLKANSSNSLKKRYIYALKQSLI